MARNLPSRDFPEAGRTRNGNQYILREPDHEYRSLWERRVLTSSFVADDIKFQAWIEKNINYLRLIAHKKVWLRNFNQPRMFNFSRGQVPQELRAIFRKCP